MSAGDLLFAALLRAYPRKFRQQYGPEMVAFFEQERQHPKYGSGPLRPLRFWSATVRDVARVAVAERFGIGRDVPSAILPHPREARPGVLMRSIAALQFDIRNAIRSLRATPAVTLTALIVFALGIGAATAIFSVVDGIVLRGLPFRDESTLVSIAETDVATGRPVPAAYPNFADWSERQDVFESLAASANGAMLTFAEGEHPERVRPHRVTVNLFDVLGVRPAIGGGFSSVDVRNNPLVALISDGLWRRRFNADPAVVGRTMPFESGAYQVIGVMPRGFTYPVGSAVMSAIDLWVPYVAQPKEPLRTGGRNYSLRVIGRLKQGVTLQQASARMQQIRDTIAAENPKWADHGIIVRPVKDSVVPASVRSWMMMLLGAVAGVLLVACANVANLLLARATARSREIGVRAAMGATRWQLVRGLIVESVILALAGTAAGLLLAYWGVDVLRATLPATLPRVANVAVDMRVVGVSALAAIVTGALCGMLPALQMSRVDVSSALRSARGATASRGRQRIRTAFLVVEVALAAILLVGAGVFTSSFVRLVRTDLGFDASRVLSVIVTGTAKLTNDAYLQALEQIRTLPQVESAAIVAGGAPLSGSWSTRGVEVAGRAADEEAVVKQTTSEYFETIGATLLRGRTIAATDRAGAPLVVVVNDEAARRYFGQQEAVGAQITIENDSPRTVVGVVRGMRLLGPEGSVQPEAYVPYEQTKDFSVSPTLVVRTSGDAAAMIPEVRNAIWAAIPKAIIPDPQTFEQQYASLIALRKLNMILLGVFGALALMIASIGIYGIFAYLVEQQTKEIGVRMALGAVPGRILSMVLSRASAAIAIGLAIGFLGAAWLERLVLTFVFRGIPHDPMVYGSAAALLMALGLLAAYVPARRAAHVDPLVALRTE